MSKWYNEKGEQNDIVLSTRIRLARNLADFNFPSRLDAEEKKKVCETIKSAVLKDGLNCIDMKDLDKVNAVSLAERHLISPEFAECADGTSLILSEDESISIMLCEEDHIRLQVMKPGLALEEAYKIADEIDSAIDGSVKYAFDEKIGYLTSCPTNLGTAMRASVFLHLPALTACGQIAGLANTVSKLGLSISGVYGRRSKPLGDIYQVSNQLTLGITEENAMANLKSIVMQLVSQERNAAKRAVKEPSEEDRIYRALGVLENARLLGGTEFMELISAVRLGAAAGVLDIPIEKLNALIIEMQPATVSVMNENTDTIQARDAVRAEKVREALD